MFEHGIDSFTGFFCSSGVLNLQWHKSNRYREPEHLVSYRYDRVYESLPCEVKGLVVQLVIKLFHRILFSRISICCEVSRSKFLRTVYQFFPDLIFLEKFCVFKFERQPYGSLTPSFSQKTPHDILSLQTSNNSKVIDVCYQLDFVGDIIENRLRSETSNGSSQYYHQNHLR